MNQSLVFASETPRRPQSRLVRELRNQERKLPSQNIAHVVIVRLENVYRVIFEIHFED